MCRPGPLAADLAGEKPSNLNHLSVKPFLALLPERLRKKRHGSFSSSARFTCPCCYLFPLWSSRGGKFDSARRKIVFRSLVSLLPTLCVKLPAPDLSSSDTAPNLSWFWSLWVVICKESRIDALPGWTTAGWLTSDYWLIDWLADRSRRTIEELELRVVAWEISFGYYLTPTLPWNGNHRFL